MRLNRIGLMDEATWMRLNRIGLMDDSTWMMLLGTIRFHLISVSVLMRGKRGESKCNTPTVSQTAVEAGRCRENNLPRAH